MNLRKFIATALAVFAALWFFGHCTACLTDQAKKDVAQDVYAAQQAACIDQYADKPSIDKCRDRVKKAWLATDAGTRTLAFGNDNGHPDAGTDAEAGQ